MIRSKLKSRLGKTLAAAALVGVMVAAPLVASAATYNLTVTNEQFNVTHYYDAARYHSNTSGPGGSMAATFALQSHSGMCGGNPLKLALRQPSTGNSTYYQSWSAPGGARNFTWYTGSSALPAGSYTVTATNACAGMPDSTYSWAGSLIL